MKSIGNRMITRPLGDRIKRILGVTIGVSTVVAIVALAVTGFLLNKITARIELPTKGAPNEMDFESGRKKLQLLQQPAQSAKRGFVSFSDSELNSLLERQYLGRTPAGSGNTNAMTCQVLAARLLIGTSSAIWTCWVQKKWWGRKWNVVWQREIVLTRLPDRWNCKVLSMRLGRYQVSPKYWKYVHQLLGDADGQLAVLYDWLAELPALDLAISDTSLLPELRIYNYGDPKVLEKFTP